MVVFFRNFTALLLIIFCGTGCEVIGPDSESTSPRSINIDVLFEEPTNEEIQSIQDNWEQRDVTAQGIELLSDEPMQVFGEMRSVKVFAHQVGEARHIGAVAVPPSVPPGSVLPVLVYSHFGDDGINLDETFALFALALEGVADSFVLVVPSFRSERITVNGRVFQSSGDPSPWDFDVDDSIALLNVVFDQIPEADSTRVGILGISRGAGVALLMAIRDTRVDRVVSFFGPTDFFVPSLKEVTEEVLNGEVRDLPGLDYLNETFLTPLSEGEISAEEVRLEYIRRSSVYFANALPLVQVHHGDRDDTVSVEHAFSLEQALVATGRPLSDFEVYIYPGAGHNPLEMPSSLDRSVTFLGQLTVD